jgi:hypothetical protein
MEFNHFFEKIAQEFYPYEEPKNPQRGLVTTQGSVIGGIVGYALKDKLKEAIKSDAAKNPMRSIYRPDVLEKLIKSSPLIATVGGSALGALALRKLYNLSE